MIVSQGHATDSGSTYSPAGHLRPFLQSSFPSSESQPVLRHGVTLSHVHISAFPFAGLHQVFLQPVDMVLSGSPPFWHVTHCSSLVPSMDFLWGHSILSVWLLMRKWNNISPGNKPPANLQSSYHCPSSVTVRADFHPLSSLHIQSFLLHFTNKPAMRGCMESLSEFKVSPFAVSSQCS